MIELHAGRIVAGRYRLERPLAKGGMGSVWAAEHLMLDVPVAVKFIDPHLPDQDELRVRFQREAKAAAKLSTPHVVRIHDYGIEDDIPFLVMEFLRGEDLGSKLAREHRLSLADAMPILNQIAKALQCAHEVGIVHRDLKPANIFITRQSDELCVKVLDFGIAKLLLPDAIGDVTKTGAILGSPHYMSPEHIRGLKEVDHRSDLWALGVIIYRMLTGNLPFAGSHIGDVFLKICTERPTAPSECAPELDKRIDAFIEKALAVEPARRFQSVKEMMDDLSGLCTRSTIPAHASFIPETIAGALPASEPSSGENTNTDAPVTRQVKDRARPRAVQPSEKWNTPTGPRRTRTWAALGLLAGIAVVVTAGLFAARGRGTENLSEAPGTLEQPEPPEPAREPPLAATEPQVIPAPSEQSPAPSTSVTATSPSMMSTVRSPSQTVTSAPGGQMAQSRISSAQPKPAPTPPASADVSKKSKRFGF